MITRADDPLDLCGLAQINHLDTPSGPLTAFVAPEAPDDAVNVSAGP